MPTAPARLRAIEWILRVGACMCFVGHGAFGIIGKRAWLAYFAVAGIGPDQAWALMPAVGALDITVGILALIAPTAAGLAWMTAWAVWTALLRPLAGEPAWEALERAGNYGVPLALLIMTRPAISWRTLFRRVSAADPGDRMSRRLQTALVATTAALLAGHGALAVLGKPELVKHFALLPLPWPAPSVTVVAGLLDIALAGLVTIRPAPALCVGIAAWKLGTELLFLPAGAPIWEVIERGGSYAAPLALAVLLHGRAARASSRPLQRTV